LVNSKKYRFLQLATVLLAAFFLFGCNPLKYVPSDKYLLTKVKVICDNKKIDKLELTSCVRQKPNKKVLGMKFYLGLYNMSNIKKTTGFNKQLREMGEAPVIFDQSITQMSVDQLKNYLISKGYMNAEVEDTVLFKKRKAQVTYKVYPKKPYIIRSMKYSFEDTSIRQIFFKDTVNLISDLKVWNKGLFDMDLLNQERGNIEYYMRNNGYYRFSRDMISFDADTLMNQVDLVLNVNEEVMKTPNGQLVSIPHKQYKINQVTILTENNPFRKNLSAGTSHQDTILKYGVKFIYQNNFWVRPSIIQQSNYILPGSLFRISDVEQTKSHLSSLNVFNVVNTNQFKELPAADTARYYYLNCKIRLTPASIQSFDWGLVGTNSSGNFGGAATLTYQHRSLFGNAENLSLKLRWAMEALQQKSSNKIGRDLEYGIESTLNIPKFLIPFNSFAFRKKYNPKTYFTLAYNFQDIPNYLKNTSVNASYGYKWVGALYKTHLVTPINLNYTYLLKSPAFDDQIKYNLFLQNLYNSHVVTSSSYTFRYDNQDYKKRSDYRYFQANIEVAGNILTAFNYLTNAAKDSTGRYYSLFKLQYAQYIRTELDFHYFHVINAYMGTAYRLYAGVGVPYGNANSLPFEKQFFSGGANSIRGWQVRALGPGSYVDTSKLIYPNSTGDIKLEGNIEHRFKLFWYFEGAIFAEAGNIWLLPSNDNTKPQNAIFKWNEFYKQIAVGSGFGLRLNFTYFLLRVDLGMKVRDPARSQWVYDYGKLVWKRDFALSFAIGYPF
jgi:outer membrane protein assembly factor BamA